MAKAIISEIKNPGFFQGSPVPIAALPEVATQAVTYTTATNAAAFNADTTLIRFIADADAFVKVGGAADANSLKIISGTPEYFAVAPGDVMSIYDGIS